MSGNHHSLESEKYLMSSIKEDQILARHEARAKAEQAITNLIILVLAISAGYYVVQSMPVWLPIVETAFHKLTSYKFA